MQRTYIETARVRQRPFRYFTSEQVLSPELAGHLLHWLETGVCWRLHQESFFEQYECNLLSVPAPNGCALSRRLRHSPVRRAPPCVWPYRAAARVRTRPCASTACSAFEETPSPARESQPHPGGAQTPDPAASLPWEQVRFRYRKSCKEEPPEHEQIALRFGARVI